MPWEVVLAGFRAVNQEGVGMWQDHVHVPSTAASVAKHAQQLLQEYRKMAQLFRHDVILHPLGGDFRYVNEEEIHATLDSFTHIMQQVGLPLLPLHPSVSFASLIADRLRFGDGAGRERLWAAQR
jgi:hypothetical protein